MASVVEALLTSWAKGEAGLAGLAEQTCVIAGMEANPRAAEALLRAGAALREDSTEVALSHLLYAQRQAPSSSLITLLIGDLRLHLGLAEAAEPFDLLARRSGWNAVWYRLALTRMRASRPDLAAIEIHETLSRNAPILDQPAIALLDDILQATGARGWCGLNTRGDLFVGGPVIRRGAPMLSVTADGMPLRLGARAREPGFVRFALGQAALGAETIEVTSGGVPLVGSRLKPQSVIRCEGFVERTEAGIAGWCWLPGAPDVQPRLQVRGLSSAIDLTAEAMIETAANLERLIWQRGFSVPFAELPDGQLALAGPHGRPLYGSPLRPTGGVDSGMVAASRLRRRFPALGKAEAEDSDVAAEISIPAAHRGRRAGPPPQPVLRQTLIAIPVYRGLRSTIDCVRSVLEHRGPDEVILVISDASPEPALVEALTNMARKEDIQLRLETVNRGFPGTVNLAMRQAAEAGQDIVLLNSDTLVAPHWVAGLRRATYAESDIGTATPFSNAATILSYPDPWHANAIPTEEETAELAAAFAAENGEAVAEIPTGHGFCLYIRHACLVETGILREDVFAQGYGEENDFCMRARHLGWRHVAATGCYIGHLEGQSFAAAKESLVRRNLKMLNTLHPGYDSLIADWEKADPLFPHRRLVDQARLRAIQRDRRAIGFVTHNREGGVQRHVLARARQAEEAGFLALIVRATKDRTGGALCEVKTPSLALPNLQFHAGSERPLLEQFLRACRLDNIELHHFIGHEPETIAMVTALGIPFDLHLHDYAWFCPRITLTAQGNRYCGEPELKVCEDCVRDRGGALDRDIQPGALIAWSQDIFDRARVVIAPTADTALRFRRRFGVQPQVRPWETDHLRLQGKPIRPITPGGAREVCIAGAIGYEKGYQILLDCARLAQAEDLPILFQIVGFTCDDERLLETGKVTITGRYEESEAIALIKAQNADLAFLPALWPETWSYVLSQLWQAELPVVAFDIGAQAERIKSNGGGVLLPLSLPPRRIIQALCNVVSSTQAAA
ncbi:glycosyltransferase [Acidisoma cellulosilytica]|uniref:Glycosyltransferase n=1 Tax=Acidisoma cellulosilyticum TaxID=2802395 RepID=A0A963YZG7_9PROT|nr:glycosyltransferase [Acidisoma cellulosilyticum]MCB8879776.1 glycosyltransferase [Acidisoma cellulosilyticum]